MLCEGVALNAVLVSGAQSLRLQRTGCFALKIVLHVCCGPCSTVPIEEFAEQGHELEIFYSNSNIHPWAEYVLRRDTAAAYAKQMGIPFVEGTYNPKDWFEAVGSCREYGVERCSQCYRMRFADPAAYAQETGADAVASSLTISPYQFTDAINRELSAAAREHGVLAVESDFRARYRDSVEMSRKAGMYRQNYCGCMYSQVEAQGQREAAKAARAAARAKKRQEKAESAENPARSARAGEPGSSEQGAAAPGRDIGRDGTGETEGRDAH